ncbi:MAG: FAD-binding protein [Planctomycetota bacterium]
MDSKNLNSLLIQDIYSQDLSEIPGFIRKLLLGQSTQSVIQPETVEEVCAAIIQAKKEQAAITPRAMASWALGGVTPLKKGYVLDLKHLNRIETTDPAKQHSVIVEAGTTWDDLTRTLEPLGFTLYTYPTSRFSTVGGWISTGGYGVNSFKYGHLSNQLLWIEVVKPDGQIKKMSSQTPEFKYFIGTEGQMGIITRACLKVRPQPAAQTVRLLYYSSFKDVVNFLQTLKKKNVNPTPISSGPTGIRYFNPETMNHFNQLLGEPLFKITHALLINFEDAAKDEREKIMAATEEAPVHLARYLWHERFFPMKAKRLGRGLLAAETILPVEQMAAYLNQAETLARTMGITLAHDIHILPEGAKAQAISLILCDQIKTISYLDHLIAVLMLTRLGHQYQGQPYGLGIWNIPFREMVYPKTKWSVYQFYKKQVDPLNLMNPGKSFSTSGRNLLLRLALNPLLVKPALDIFIKINSWLSKISKNTRVAEDFSPPSSFKEKQIGQTESLNVPSESDGNLKVFATLENSVYTCARCGSCLPVCPAYQVTGNELVSARGKLIFARKLLAGEKLNDADAQQIFACLHCRACEEVCQTELPLGECWDELEKLVEEKFGWPKELIEKFVAEVETSPKYEKLLARR